MPLHEATKLQIEDLITHNELVLFMKGTKTQPRCGFSAAVVQILNDLSVPFLDVDVLQNPLLREGIKEFGNWPTIPQLYYRGSLFGGCDIIRELHEQGELGQSIGLSLEKMPPKPAVGQMTVKELKIRLDNRELLRLYDVRTEAERNIAKLPSALWFDDAARASLSLLPRDALLVFHCHHGGRSQTAAEFYSRQGFRNVWNVQGGIDAWSLEIDPTVQRY